jgi:Ca2+/Na+ antiporter
VARRRKRSKAGQISFGALAILLVSLYLVARKAWPVLGIFWLFALVLWVAFFKRTQCDVETSSGEACGNPARGRLRACYLVKHKRAKHDALWAMMKLSNPAMRYRIKWVQPRSAYSRESPQLEEETPSVVRPVYDGAMLAATVVVAVAAVITLGLQFHSLA